MPRPGLRLVLLFALSIHLHHHFRGAPLDYWALAAAAGASWVGVPGPGEPVLVAGGLFAAQHRLDIVSVLLVAFAGAAIGGVVGWLLGFKAGRGVLSAPGPLRRMRRKALARGDEVFARARVVAVMLAPSWIAGIHRVRSGIFLPVNALAAAIWAAGIGLGAYAVGPAVLDVVDDLGLVLGGALVLLVLAVILGGARRRRRQRELAP